MRIQGSQFVDESGRSLILRGVNLGGDSKVPTIPDGRTDLLEGFYEARKVSFVGRPFPLDESDKHFSRLARWGQRFLRLLVTWEAIEHAGPGIYDESYLGYIEAIVERAAKHGISLFIDPHQDVWSRWTGGDGAPMWTLEAAGFEPRRLHASGAALVHQESGASYPRMQWFSNHHRLACATMFTLFYGGNDFAPDIRVEGEPIQDYLQGHYLAAIKKLAGRLAEYPNVVGFDSLNEPGDGFIGLADARLRRGDLVLPGLAPTAFEAMKAGEGLPTDAARMGLKGLGLAKTGRERLGEPGVRAWKDGTDCVWIRSGVWKLAGGEAVLAKPAWFSERLCAGRGGLSTAFASRGEAFCEFYLKPFIVRFASEIRGAATNPAGSAGFAIFVEGPPQGTRPTWKRGETPPEYVNSTHWYDAFTLTFKRWTGFLAWDEDERRPVIGPKAVRAYFHEAMRRIAEHSKEKMGGCPSLVGEFGLPFDLNRRRAYRNGDYRLHEKALAAYYDALDASLLDATIWNYTATNSHEHGDGWNGEDLSVFSAEDGGRALAGFVRPYAMAVAGKPAGMGFDLKSGTFFLTWEPDAAIKAPTEVFMPAVQYPRGFSVETEGCEAAERKGEEPGDPSILELAPEPEAKLCKVVLRRL
ncbi:MAG: cellulase family glycosylhydrolase [Spirochaetes bacterium]|nr:cellulase family glycosylhydrolase [Spirochaetota bacterium]